MAAKYLKGFPKPLLDDLVSGRWLPVVGAGMSLNARLPVPNKMPLWPNLGKIIGDELTDFVSASTLDAISAYQHEYGRAKLIERLTEVLYIKEAQPGDAHKAFCSIPFDIVCTTNFDFLLERQYEAEPRYVYPVIDEEQLSINGAMAGTLLLKLHGDLRHPSRLVVSEEDYDGFLAKYPMIATYLSNQLITKTAVFVGYSLDDPDFRQIWNVVSERLGRTRRMAYSIMVDASASDVARFERRGVKVINLAGSKDKYGDILSQTFRELRDYLRNNVISVSQVTEEESLRELVLPRDATTRLCFFALPLELLSIYRSRVFPAVEKAGFVPVTANDVISPGDNVNAKIDALIDRASVMVVELNSNWTRAELDIAIARNKVTESNTPNRRELAIIVVVSEQSEVPTFASDFLLIRRPNLLTEGVEELVSKLVDALRTHADRERPSRRQEARRLLDAREFPAAVVSAMTTLEASLRNRLESSPDTLSLTASLRPMAFRSLLDLAAGRRIISNPEYGRIRTWMTIRNQIVHTAETITPKVAREIVEGVLAIVQRLMDDENS